MIVLNVNSKNGGLQMKHLLSKSTQRQLDFIEILFLKDDWIPINAVANKLNCSSRILWHDIDYINQSFSPFTIETSTQLGIMIKYPPNYSIDYIYSLTLSNSTIFNLLELLFWEEPKSINAISDKLFISVSQAYRLIDTLAPELSKLGIVISTKPYRLTGDEAAIRTLFVHYFQEKYPDLSGPWHEKQLIITKKYFENIKDISDFSISFSDSKLLTVIFLTHLARISKGYHIDTRKYTNTLDDYISPYIDSPVVQQTFYQAFNVKLTADIFQEAFSAFASNNFILTLDELNQKLETDDQALVTQIELIRTFLNDLASKLQVAIPNYDNLVFEIYNIHKLFIGKNYILYNRRHFFAQYALKEYPNFFSVLSTELKNFKYDKVFEWTEDSFNEVLYTLLIHWKNIPKELSHATTPLNIALFLDYDSDHHLFISDLIKYHFDDHVTLTLLESITFDEALQETINYDLTITNISNLKTQSAYTICINSVPTSRDLKNINQIISLHSENDILLSTKFQN